MATKARPNEQCPCGSGRKFKHCCAINDVAANRRRKRNRILAAAACISLVGLFAVAVSVGYSRDNARSAAAGPAPRNNTAAQPMGLPTALGPGTVFNTEHEHLHWDPPIAQPPGDVPEGKIWNGAHGHWHNSSEFLVETVGAKTPAPN